MKNRYVKKVLDKLSIPESAIMPAILIVFIVILFGSGAIILWASQLKIPDFDSFAERKVSQSTKIYDRTGKVLLYSVHDKIRRTVVPYEDISRHIKNATVAIEDKEFYNHVGIKPRSILRAFIANTFAGETVQGGSTITQQVVKNTLLTKEKKLSRKIKEAILALKLEQALTKDEILNTYLNEIPYGGTIYGVEEAAQSFFGKPAKDITLTEAAYLASLPKAPTYFSPYGEHVDELESRKNLVLTKMEELDFITKEEADTARAEQVTFVKEQERNIKAPHFVMFVRKYLEETYGQEAIEERGFKVITTLDYEMQKKAEEIITEYGIINEKENNAKNAGMVALDPKTGGILVMVGSRDYFDIEHQGNYNVTTAERQPGSAIKPFIYAAAFNKGYTPETVVFDVQTQFSTACGPTEHREGCYMPGNYDDAFRGPMSLRNALAQSINIPAVKVLYLVGMTDAIELAREMGITTFTDPKRYGLSLVLGGGEVSLLELVNAYGVFANDGSRVPYTSIIRVEDLEGEVLEETKEEPKRVIPENVSRQISSILSDNVARTPAFGADSPLNFPGRQVAVKTGTTNDYHDAWVVGYTPSIVVGTWVGNNDNTPMERKISRYLVVPMWNAFLRDVLPDLPDESFAPPVPTSADIKPVLRGIWQSSEENGGAVHEILHYVDTDNPLGPPPRNPASDSQYYHWEVPVQSWLKGATFPIEGSPTESGEVTFLAPDANTIYNPSEPITITLGGSLEEVESVTYSWNGNNIGTANQSPFQYSFVPEDEGVRSENTLRARINKKNGDRESTSVEVTLAS